LRLGWCWVGSKVELGTMESSCTDMAAVPRRRSVFPFVPLGAFLGYLHMPLRHTGLEHIFILYILSYLPGLDLEEDRRHLLVC
jgi:hypothetical protein